MFGYSNQELLEFTSKKKSNKKLIIIISALLLAIVTATSIGAYYYLNIYSKPYGKYDLDEYVKVGKYLHLPLKSQEIKITKKQIDDKVAENVETTAAVKEVETGEVENGDTINIDYTGKIGKETIKDGSAKNVTLTVGAGEFVSGFESGLIGSKVGSKVTLHIKFPDDYTKKELAGKKVTYDININSKEEATIPKYNNDWVKENTQYSNTEEYEKSIESDLYDKALKTQKKEEKETLWKEVIDDSKVKKYPKEEIERIRTAIVLQYKMYAKQYKMKYKDFLEQQMGMAEEDFKENLNKYAKDEVKQEEITYWIAKKEKIEVTDKEYKNHINKVLKEYGYTKKSFEKENGKTYEEYAGELNIYSEIYKEKVKNFVYKNAEKS